MPDDGPLIVQSDKTFLLDTRHPLADEARVAVSSWAILERQPEYFHSYRITPLGLWNASASGVNAIEVCETLQRYSKFVVPDALLLDIAETMSHYGRLRIESSEDGLLLIGSDLAIIDEIRRHKTISPFLKSPINGSTGRGFAVNHDHRGALKQALLKLGWPVEDLAGFIDGAELVIEMNENWHLRGYQSEAVERFTDHGSGVIVLPCGGGKTIVAIAAMIELHTSTLILATNTASVRQWKREILARTTLTDDQVGEYSGARKEIRPVTIATFQVMTTKDREGKRTHLELFDAQDWGLIIYDEVHMVPAPVFALTADIQSTRRLGLTATLVREDGREGDVFTLIGPKRYEAPWKVVEDLGGIAVVDCTEVRVPLSQSDSELYAELPGSLRYKFAATAVNKLPVVQSILTQHPGESTLVIGCYLDQLTAVSEELGGVPIIQGCTPQDKRDELFQQFREGSVPVLVVSKVANFSIDLPDASVAIQISGTFGSRQEEGQRVGRITRPKSDGRTAHFYTVVTADTIDTQYALHRQRFLTEQGYKYRIIDAGELTEVSA